MSTKCLSTCNEGVVSDNGCICKGDPKGDWCYVSENTCPEIVQGRLPTFLTRPYDTVTKPKKGPVCVDWDKRVKSCNPKVNKGVIKRILTNSKIVGGLLSLTGAYGANRTVKKINASDMEASKRLFKDVKDHIKLQEKLGNINKETADMLIDGLQDQFDASPLEFIRDVLSVTRNTLKSTSNVDTPMLDLVLSSIPVENYGELIRGAHFVIEDGGKLYRKHGELEKTFERISSHHKTVKGVPHMAGTEWVGTTPFHVLAGLDKDGNTWFQLEASPFTEGKSFPEVISNIFKSDKITRELFYSIDHTFDFLAYRLSPFISQGMQNIGPLGSSYYTEQQPIYVAFPDSGVQMDTGEIQKIAGGNGVAGALTIGGFLAVLAVLTKLRSGRK